MARRAASRRNQPATPAWMWLLTGILIGLGLAWYLFAKGYIPQPQVDAAQSAESPAPGSGAPAGGEEVAPRKDDRERPQYDFFTVLPEMEVVVPEQELSERVKPQPNDAPADADAADSRYLLQVGSFRSSSDAEQLKARLALLGVVAQVQTVTVNDATWHRVRVGPVSTAREADAMRSRLADNGIDSMVLKAGAN